MHLQESSISRFSSYFRTVSTPITLYCLGMTGNHFQQPKAPSHNTVGHIAVVSDRTEPDMSFELFEPDKSPVQLYPILQRLNLADFLMF